MQPAEHNSIFNDNEITHSVNRKRGCNGNKVKYELWWNMWDCVWITLFKFEITGSYTQLIKFSAEIIWIAFDIILLWWDSNLFL